MFSNNYGQLNWVALDADGNVVGWGDDNEDYHVYIVDDGWDGTYEGIDKDRIIGWELTTNGNYTLGRPCYYLASRTRAVGFMFYGGQCLMYGKRIVNGQIDYNWSAVLEYFIGNDFALNENVMKEFLSLKEIQEKIIELRNNPQSFIPTKTTSIDMTSKVGHLGDTSYSYYATSSYIIMNVGVTDSFSDPLCIGVIEELVEKGILDKDDHMGPRYEVPGGTPYYYIPCSIMIRRK